MDIVQTLQKELEQIDNVEFGYLFGSYAKGRQTQNSDIDIALYLKDSSLDNILQINYILSKKLNIQTDILILNSAKNLFLLDSVFRDGIIVKDSPIRIDYELKKEHLILDYKAFKKSLNVA